MALEGANFELNCLVLQVMQCYFYLCYMELEIELLKTLVLNLMAGSHLKVGDYENKSLIAQIPK